MLATKLKKGAPVLKLVLPIAPSVNHMYKRTWKNACSKTETAKAWCLGAGLIARRQVNVQNWPYIEDKRKIVVELIAYWPNAHRRDMSNMHKIIPDVLEKIAYADDRYTLVRDIDFKVDSDNPRVEVSLHLLADEVEL